MFVLSNLIATTATILDMALGLYTLLIFGRIVLSWVSADPHNPIVQILYQTTEPVLRPIRRRIGTYSGLDHPGCWWPGQIPRADWRKIRVNPAEVHAGPSKRNWARIASEGRCD